MSKSLWWAKFLRIQGFSDSKFHPKIISKTLPEQYIFDNGGRDYLLKKYGLGEAELLKSLKNSNKI